MTTVVVLQSNYIPWKGYFDLIHDADLFIFYDDLQYTKNDWRNRNKIKTPKGADWLTIPVGTNQRRLICEVELEDPAWQARHWNAICQHYRRCPFFDTYRPLFEEVFCGCAWSNLSVLNQFIITRVARDVLGVRTEFADSRQYGLVGHKLDRVIELVRKAGASVYVTGPSAKGYIVPERFDEVGVGLVWKDYSGYPEYPQRYPPFDHAVSILDLLFNVGPDAPWYIWGWRDGSRGPG